MRVLVRPRLGPRFCLTLVLALIVLLPGAAAAQMTRVAGVVLSDDGKPVRGAAVVAAQDTTDVNNPRQTVSDEKGRFTLIGLPTGAWWLVASAPGFEPQRLGIRVRVLGAPPSYTMRLTRDPLWRPDALEDIDAAAIFRDMDRAEQAAKAGRHDEAITVYRSLLQKAPALTTLQAAIAGTQHDRGAHADAAATYRGFLAGEPDAHRARIHLAECLRETGDAAGAERELRLVIERAGTSPEGEAAALALRRLHQ